ncbi:MAG: hypothetical protein JWO62_3227 [Acidimicrobiaceae bacterium]|jgi:hypothetical protein|nr:hypothetical protein [Acidimicrobiaceae bacterium]
MARTRRLGTVPVLLLAVLAISATVALTSGAGGHRVSGAERTAADRRAKLVVHNAVGLAHCTYRDPLRTTYDYATGATLPGRTLLTEIRYPARVAGSGEIAGAPAAYRGGPYPTIFFAPGFAVTPDTYAALLDAWVRAGFVVVAPTFPDTNPAAVAAARTGNAEDDVVNQPADMAFVIRQSVAATRTAVASCRVVRGLIDPAEIGIAGQSDGGETVAMLAYDRAPGYASMDAGLHIRAAAVMSGSEVDGNTYGAAAGDPALLVVQSSTDQCNPPQESTQLYDAIGQSDKWFLDIEHANHLPPYDGKDPAAFAAVARVTERFFLLELRGKVPAAGFIAYGNSAPAVAALSTGAIAPPLPKLEFAVAACYLP